MSEPAATTTSTPTSSGRVIHAPPFHIYFDRNLISYEDAYPTAANIRFSPQELEVLGTLLSEPDRPFSPGELITTLIHTRLSDPRYPPDVTLIKVLIHHIRAKLRAKFSDRAAAHVITNWGRGYSITLNLPEQITTRPPGRRWTPERKLEALSYLRNPATTPELRELYLQENDLTEQEIAIWKSGILYVSKSNPRRRPTT